ncbi:MAG: DEAD/DEAH box helicase [Spirochaetota bacterium]
MIEISYDRGTLIINGDLKDIELPSYCIWDERENIFRLKAISYYELIPYLIHNKIQYKDNAKNYKELNLISNVHQEPYPYQKEALNHWLKNKGRGVVVLPTGSGKSYLATLSIEKVQRSTLLIVPTIDLMNQWYDTLKSTFDVDIGLIGGGYHEIQNLTITTYDSAYIHMEKLGNLFGFLIFDECHHLPGETYSLSSSFSIAPFRLGLTATPERTDGLEHMLNELIGKTVYRKDITELSGKYLADYETIKLTVELNETQINEYLKERKKYTDFIRNNNIPMSQPNGWNKFIMIASQSKKGREALESYRRQKELALAAPAKIVVLEKLLHKHKNERVLIFTQDNKSVYQISKKFLIPSITHQTKVKERSEILNNFNEGIYTNIVTSKVLNEGVNVPKASVGIILSGSGSIMEHVQRLGRILRKSKDKKALLYEVVTGKTTEEYISKRRRRHNAYQ